LLASELECTKARKHQDRVQVTFIENLSKSPKIYLCKNMGKKLPYYKEMSGASQNGTNAQWKTLLRTAVVIRQRFLQWFQQRTSLIPLHFQLPD